MTGAPRVTIVVMAGGDATRLPGKLSLPVGDEPMLVRTFKRLAQSGLPMLVSARARPAPELAALSGTPVVLDEHEGAGPLGALVAAASCVDTPLVFVAAGDMPGIEASLVFDLMGEYDRLCAAGERPDAVVPQRESGLLEPLAALYDAKAIARSGARMLAAGARKVTAALEGLRVARVRVSEDDARLVNVNTAEDYARLPDRGGRP